MVKNGVYLRKVNLADKEFLLKLANDLEVRKNAFHSEQITSNEHDRWFASLMNDKSQFQYILMRGNDRIGQIRLSISGDSGVIDYSVMESERGKGYGTRMLNLLLESIDKECIPIKRVIGRVKSDNNASSSCFVKSGFKPSFTEYELCIEDKNL